MNGITDGAHTRIVTDDELSCTCTLSESGEQQVNPNCPDHAPIALVLDLNDRHTPGHLVNALAESGVVCTYAAARRALDLMLHGQAEPQRLGAVVRDADGTYFTRVVIGGTCPWVSAAEHEVLEEGEVAGWPWSRIESPALVSPGTEV